MVTAVVTWDEARERDDVRGQSRSGFRHDLALDLAALGTVAEVSVTVLTGPIPYAVNTGDAPDSVTPTSGVATVAARR